MFSTPSELFASRWQQDGGRVRIVKETQDSNVYAWSNTETLGLVGSIANLSPINGGVGVSLDSFDYPQYVPRDYVRPESLSRQDVFDIASHHALEVLRGRRSAGRVPNLTFDRCAYELNGVQCFVGALVPDPVVRGSLDGAYDKPEVISVLRDSGVPNTPGMQTLLEELQNIHDSIGVTLTEGRRRHVWRRSLRRLALRLNLTCRDRLWLLAPKERKEYEGAASNTD